MGTAPAGAASSPWAEYVRAVARIAAIERSMADWGPGPDAEANISLSGYCARQETRRELAYLRALVELHDENVLLRRIVFLRHAVDHPLSAGDGRLDCTTCQIDFKHAPAIDISEALLRQGAPPGAT